MDRQILHIAAGFLAFTLLMLAAGWLLGEMETALKLAFLTVLVFIALLAMLSKRNALARTEEWKKNLEEEVLLESKADLYEGGSPEAVDAVKSLGTEYHGVLYATPTYLVFKSESPAKEFSLKRDEVLNGYRGRLLENGKSAETGFHGLLVLRLKKEYYKFVVDDIDRWLALFGDHRYGSGVSVRLEK